MSTSTYGVVQFIGSDYFWIFIVIQRRMTYPSLAVRASSSVSEAPSHDSRSKSVIHCIMYVVKLHLK